MFLTRDQIDYENVPIKRFQKENIELLEAVIFHSNPPPLLRKKWKPLKGYDKGLMIPPPDMLRNKRLQSFDLEKYIPRKPLKRNENPPMIPDVFPSNITLKKLDFAVQQKKKKFTTHIGNVMELQNLKEKYEDSISKLKVELVNNIDRLKKRQAFRNFAKRKHIYSEILATEMTYVKSLELFQSKYVDNLVNYLSPEIHQEITSKLKLIININKPFLSELQKHLKEYLAKPLPDPKTSTIETRKEPHEVALLFIYTSSDFKSYTKYANFFNRALSEINRLLDTNEKFKEFTQRVRKELKAQRERCTTIRSFLIMPIQRIPRYKLLLEDLLRNGNDLKHYDPDHYNHLEFAVHGISATANFLNQKKKTYENAMIVRSFVKKHKQFKFLLTQRLYRRTTLLLGEERSEILFYLFSETLILERKGKFVLVNIKDRNFRCYLHDCIKNCFFIELEKVRYYLYSKSIEEIQEIVKIIYEKTPKEYDDITSYNPYIERPVFFGYLKKEGKGIKSRRLNKRWFVVTSDYKIKYYDKEGGKYKGGYSLVGVTVGKSKGRNYRFGFYVKLPKRTYFLRTESEDENQRWLDVLVENLKLKQE